MLIVIISYYRAGAPKTRAHYGQGSGPILLDGLECEGDESNLEECAHRGWGVLESCYHSEDAGVKCCKYAKSASSYSKPNLTGLHISQSTF